MILDIHTHRNPPQPESIISLSPADLPAAGDFPGQLYSAGIHPWNVRGVGVSADELEALTRALERQDVVAVGECGIDMARDGAAPLFAQMTAFKHQVELSEKLRKPMIIHAVKAHDQIIGIRKDMGAKMPWIIHGFRGKPTILNMLINAGIAVSYGEKFNPESLAMTPLDMIFAETDESALDISDIIANLATVRPEISSELIGTNTSKLLK